MFSLKKSCDFVCMLGKCRKGIEMNFECGVEKKNALLNCDRDKVMIRSNSLSLDYLSFQKRKKED